MENKVASNDARTYIVEPGTIVAVTGSTGFIGGRLVERLVEQGAAVTCLLRGDPSPRLQRLGAKLCKIDIADEDAVRSSLKGIDWVFHCAYDSDNTEWNFKALRALIAASDEPNKDDEPVTDEKPGPKDFTIAVEAEDGAVATLPLSRLGVLLPPIEVRFMKLEALDRRFYKSPSEPVFQSIRLPLSAFAAQNTRFDSAKLKAVRFEFDRTPSRVVVVSEIGFSAD